jgi:hypothetical protein
LAIPVLLHAVRTEGRVPVMNLTITINLDNDAMCPDEVARILDRVSADTDQAYTYNVPGYNVPAKCGLRDYNGNTVGRWEIA